MKSSYCCSKLLKVIHSCNPSRSFEISTNFPSQILRQKNSLEKNAKSFFQSLTRKFLCPWHSFEHLNVAARNTNNPKEKNCSFTSQSIFRIVYIYILRQINTNLKGKNCKEGAPPSEKLGGVGGKKFLYFSKNLKGPQNSLWK